MNKAYRLIWSKAKESWIIAAEIIKGNGGPPAVTAGAVLLAAALALTAGMAQALPTAPTVINGTASFSTKGNNLTITNSPNAIINWQGFSIATGERTTFNQQNAASAVLNRVTGAARSDIFGMLDSNGRVFLLNPNGILFGAGSKVNVAGLVASSLGMTNNDFIKGNYAFNGGAQSGAVRNEGAITAAAGGNVWLIAPQVENGASGIIKAPNGNVLLAAGKSVQLVDPDNPEIAVVVSAPSDQVLNLGSITAQAGKVGIFGGLVSQQGNINADSAVAGPGGRIFLKSTIQTILTVGSVTSANALENGDGGKIVILSEGDTEVAGSINSKGGNLGGDGGFVETSGKTMDFAGLKVDASAPNGKAGIWLIDPTDVTIDSGAASAIVSALDNAPPTDVTVTTNSDNLDLGNILVNSSITWKSAAHLTLRADNNIAVNAPISGVSGNLTLDAPGAITQTAPIAAARLELLRGNFTLTDPGNLVGILAGNMTAVTLFNNQTLTVGDVNPTGQTVGLTASGNITVNNSGALTLASGSTISGSNIDLNTNASFTNSAGTGALVTGPEGRWLVWSVNPAADNRGGLIYDFKQYKATHGVTTPTQATGNGFLYSLAPTVSASLIGSVTKTYDSTTDATLTAGNYGAINGVIDGDTVSLNTTSTTGTFDDKNAGSGKTIRVSGVTLASATNGTAPVYGYTVNPNVSGAIGSISKAFLTVSATGNNKVYDGTTAATANLSDNRISGDSLTLSGTASFLDKNVAIGKPVNVAGITVSGTDAGNYTLDNSTAATTADITAKGVTTTGAVAQNKTYDGTTAATISGESLVGVIAADSASVTVSGSGSFDTRNVGGAKPVTAALILEGSAAGNYALTQPTALSADITAKGVTTTGAVAQNKTYDGTTDATISGESLVGVIAADSAGVTVSGSGSFDTRNVGGAKPVTAALILEGSAAGNYALTQPTGLSADIVSAITSQNVLLLPEVSLTLNNYIAHMHKEATDLSDERPNTHEGEPNGIEFRALPYCN